MTRTHGLYENHQMFSVKSEPTATPQLRFPSVEFPKQMLFPTTRWYLQWVGMRWDGFIGFWAEIWQQKPGDEFFIHVMCILEIDLTNKISVTVLSTPHPDYLYHISIVCQIQAGTTFGACNFRSNFTSQIYESGGLGTSNVTTKPREKRTL